MLDVTERATGTNRPIGVIDRVPLPQAQAWIAERSVVLLHETIDIEMAAGRRLAAPYVADSPWPPIDRAAMDGYAVRAADTDGAGDYNPLRLVLIEWADAALPPGAASCAVAGAPLPAGADAILPMEAASHAGRGQLDVLSPVARGAGVDMCGSGLRPGTVAVGCTRRLRPQDLALLVGLGVKRVSVVKRPRVRLVVRGLKPAPDDIQGDALTHMLRALIVRDGGLPVPADADADLVLAAGRSGLGRDDDAERAIAAAGGWLDVHGVAMRPGDTAGLGQLGGMTLLLLPGSPMACLTAYDMLASRAIRRLAGLSPALPYATADLVLGRKLVSTVGFTDIVRIVIADGRAAPLGSAENAGLVAAVRADGFVIVPEAREGYAPGAVVRVHLYDEPSAS